MPCYPTAPVIHCSWNFATLWKSLIFLILHEGLVECKTDKGYGILSKAESFLHRLDMWAGRTPENEERETGKSGQMLSDSNHVLASQLSYYPCEMRRREKISRGLKPSYTPTDETKSEQRLQTLPSPHVLHSLKLKFWNWPKYLYLKIRGKVVTWAPPRQHIHRISLSALFYCST